MKQQKETLISHKIPHLPWSKIGMDLFNANDSMFLIMVDYYSDYWEIDRMPDYTSYTVIECCKRQFSRHGIPLEVFTDNGPPFSGMDFQEFAEEWDFNHVTSSPYHSQSNGKAESAVKIAKTLRKGETCGKQFWHGETPQQKASIALQFKGSCQGEHAPYCLLERPFYILKWCKKLSQEI